MLAQLCALSLVLTATSAAGDPASVAPTRTTTVGEIAPAGPAEGATSNPSEPRPLDDGQIEIDLVTDTAIIVSALSFGVLLEGIVQTGEIRPQQAGDPSILLPIDRPRALSDNRTTLGLSNIPIATMAAYALTDSILVQALGRGERALDYGVVYFQSLSITLAITALTKLAVRRPRPKAYLAVREGRPETDVTDDALSFFSGHTSLTASMAATATYLAWTRRSSTLLEKILVTVGGLAATTAAGVLRVTEGEHFPTDVIAGGLVGYGIGTVVTHLHRGEGVSLTAGVEASQRAATIGVEGTF